MRTGKREPFDDICNGGVLGALRFREFEARGRRREKIADLDAGAGPSRRWPDPGLLAAFDRNLEAAIKTGRPRHNA